jgi:DNA-binding MarR family transcriptional regulator
VVLEVQRTYQAVMRWAVDALKPSGLTPPQFNVLRILRGAHPEALSSSKICERMVTYDPDLTRLLDRLEAAGYVQKSRDTQDRRVMKVNITKTGLSVVETGSVALRRKLQESLRPLGARKLGTLANLLEEARGIST